MPQIVAGDVRRSTDAGERPSSLGLALRPFGYLLLAVVWTILWLVTLAIPVGALVYLAVDDPDAVVDAMGRQLSNPVTAAALLLVVVPFVAVVMGPGAIFHLPTMCWPLAVLSWTYVVRSLRPSYAREKLSFTTWQARDRSLGPPGFGDVALSLQPVRPSRSTDAVMRFYVAGWSLDGRMFVAMLPVGVAWAALVGVVVPGFPTAVRVVCLTLAVLLALASVVLGARAFRRRFAAPDARGPVDARPVTELSDAERRAWRRRLERQRAARAGTPRRRPPGHR
jgi:hypothetical protein